MEWMKMTAAEISAAGSDVPVILPIAAVEQHGPHLPVSTDRMIAEHFCREIEEAIGAQVLILPTISITCSRHHQSFGGTLTVLHQTFIHYLSEVLDSIAEAGFENIVILNSHGGNQASANLVVESWGVSHPDCRLTLLTWWRAAGDELLEITERGLGGVGHAGEFETSLMMLIAPELVRSDAIARGGNIPTYEWAESDMLRGARGLVHRTTRQMTENGVFGDPTAASAEKGRQITEVVVDQLVRILRELAAG